MNNIIPRISYLEILKFAKFFTFILNYRIISWYVYCNIIAFFYKF